MTVQDAIEGFFEFKPPDEIPLVIHADANVTQLAHAVLCCDFTVDYLLCDLATVNTDGCVRIGSINDTTAEWTGGFFDASGKNFYVSIQHNISGYGTILKITGWDSEGNS